VDAALTYFIAKKGLTPKGHPTPAPASSATAFQ
jgi:hypothetical protein